MEICLHEHFPDYELIDCGGGRKLEKFSNNVLIRPEITATGKPHLSTKEWLELANAEFVETSKTTGKWNIFKPLADEWSLNYQNAENRQLCVKGKLSLTQSKHVGAFPEQVINWQFISKICGNYTCNNFLNLFGYTGLSSMAAACFFDRVTHIDSIKKVVDWTRENAELNQKSNVRFIVEDAQKFVERELKRGNKYEGIILDPPAIGSGAKNEKWIFTEMIDNLLTNVNSLCAEKSFLIMNLYAHSVFDTDLTTLLSAHFPKHKTIMQEEVKGVSRFGGKISHGVFVWLEKN